MTTPAKVSQSEVDLFKAMLSHPDQVRGSDGELRKVAGPEKQMPKRMVLAKDHSVLGPMYRELMSDLAQAKGRLSKANAHGAESGRGAFSGYDQPNPSAVDAAARETNRKKGMFAVDPHHGGQPADKREPDWGIGQPARPQTSTITDPSRAPGHSTYFHTPGKV